MDGDILGEIDDTGLGPIVGPIVDSTEGDSDSVGVGSTLAKNDGTLLGEALGVVVGLVGKADERG